jgi:polysaccharide biosynthesis protein PelD
MKFKIKTIANYKELLIKPSFLFVKWMEAILIPLIFIGLGYLIKPDDPFCLNGPFPWVFIASALVALRYGPLFGTTSLVVIFVSLYFYSGESAVIMAHKYYLLGGVILTFVCGEFSAAWFNKLSSRKQIESYIQTKLSNLANAYYVAQLSNARLQQTLINKPMTLQSAIVELRKNLINTKSVLTPEIAQHLLNLFEQFCSIEKAAIFIFKNNRFETAPLAYLGEKFELNLDDELIKNTCLGEHKTVYSTVNQLSEMQTSDYLATNLIAAGDKEILGILAIKEMSFWSLTDETLQSLNILSTYVGDQVWAIQNSASFLETYPDCPPEFAAELNKLIHLKETANINSSIVAFVVPKDIRNKVILLEINKNLSGIESVWTYTHGQHDIMFILNPFSSAVDITDFLGKIKQLLKEDFGIKLGKKQIFAKYLLIYPAKAEQIIEWMLKYIHED